MAEITIYRIECTKAYRRDGRGVWYSLEPWGGDTDYFEGADDGGEKYLLPDGYRVGQNNICCLSIYSDDGTAHDLITHQDRPAIVSNDGRVIFLRKVGDDEDVIVRRDRGRKIRLSEAEEARLVRNAEEAGLSVSAYVRARCCQ